MNKPIIQSNLMLHARIVVPTEDFQRVLTKLPSGWILKSSGPRPMGHHRYDMTRMELIVERVIVAKEDPIKLRKQLGDAIGEEDMS